MQEISREIEIEFRGVSYIYSKNTPFERLALDCADIAIEKGLITGIIGHTGSGKSTLAQLINGLLRPTSGQIFVNGADIWERPKEIGKVRFYAGLVFQYPEYQLFEETVYDDIAYGPKNMGLPEDKIRQLVMDSAEFAGITPELLKKSPFELSGGQKRRCAIAGVMAMDPKVLILDEPAAGLDPRGREEILGGITEYQKIMGNTLVIISHSMEDMARYCDKILVMNKAKPYMYGAVDEIFTRAADLKEVGLAIPQITKMFLDLKSRGIDTRTDIHTVAKGYEEIHSLLC